MKDKLLIFVTRSLWNDPHQDRHHYANTLAHDNTVIWINRPLCWRKEAKKKAKLGLEHVDRGLYVLHSGRSLLPDRLNYRLNLNTRFQLRRLLKELKKHGFDRKPDIVWIYDYKAHNFASFFNNDSKCVYFCNDYFGEYVYKRYESKLARKVDHVFCTAPKLKDRLKRFNPKCEFLPHGAWLPKKTEEFQKKDHPETVGYIGTLRNPVDTGFFWKIVRQTDFQLILGGPIVHCSEDKRKEFRELFNHQRVNYLGAMSRNEAIQAFRQIDIGLLPYICTFNKKHGFALKYFEYLAAGKPIVATPYFEWPEPYDKFVSVYNDDTKLGDFLYSVYSQWDREMFDAARSLAAESTWEHRIEQISRILSIE